jgi:endonuclease III
MRPRTIFHNQALNLPPIFPNARASYNQQMSFARKLLRWYDRHRRDLPWRPPIAAGPALTVDPYFVLISEAMLQQTQVATVIPYFQRFIAAFPTIRDLAAADEQSVLRLWQGLGYYSRARNLLAAARVIISQFDGKIPSDVQTLLILPGVGRYTAGAIASIAFNRRAPLDACDRIRPAPSTRRVQPSHDGARRNRLHPPQSAVSDLSVEQRLPSLRCRGAGSNSGSTKVKADTSIETMDVLCSSKD